MRCCITLFYIDLARLRRMSIPGLFKIALHVVPARVHIAGFQFWAPISCAFGGSAPSKCLTKSSHHFRLKYGQPPKLLHNTLPLSQSPCRSDKLSVAVLL